MMAGYIKLWRGWHENEMFSKAGPFCPRAAWVWLLENAAWKECQRRDPHGNIIAIQRGQLHTSTRALGGVWGWSKNRADRFIRDLEKCQMVDRKTDQHGMMLTITNYEKYQGDRDSLGPQSGTESDQSRTTQEEGKEDKENKNRGAAYAFFGQVIRLTDRDLAQWKRVYHAVPDIEAELFSLDHWLLGQSEAKRKAWFQTASGALNRKHQEILTARRDEDDTGMRVPC